VGDEATVVLALEANDVAEEVMQFLDRSGRARVVATATDDRQLVEAIRQLSPDAVIAHPGLVDPRAMQGTTILALDTRESITSLRHAIRAGAAGYFLWPGDRDGLAAAVASSVVAPIDDDRRAVVVAVHGARGGVGATFIATHMAAAFARRGSCVVIDADPLYGDVSAAVGMPQDGLHTLADLAPMADELTQAQLHEALWVHPEGFGVLAGPAPEEADDIAPEALTHVIRVAAAASDAVVVHLPRALDGLARAGLRSADRIIEVLSLDVLSFRAATRVLEAFDPLAVTAKVGFVVNRAARSEITVGDVARVFDAQPLAVMPVERAVGRAQDHGRLMPAKGRTGRRFDRLVESVLESSEPQAQREAAS
jgi:pilus assembly protein CpaE